MKILVVCQYYYPEPFKISDTCEELVKRGHDVTVVTGTPNYPMGVIYSGYENGKRCDEVINGVKVHRCKIAPRGQGALGRLRNYFSFARASKKYVKKLAGDFDVVFVNQLSPVMMAEAGIAYKKKHGKKLVMYTLDLWPESFKAGGVGEGHPLYKMFKMISRKVYRSADDILVSSSNFANTISQNFGVDKGIISHLPQYAESQFLDITEKENDEKFNLLFAGNVGKAQDVGVIVECAKELQNDGVLFHIVGDGLELENMKKQAEKLDNVIFYGRKPLEEMLSFYQMADAMMITLVNDPVLSLTVPAKVYTYLASGRAIVGAIDGETATLLNEIQGGFVVNSGDAKGLARQILALKNSGNTGKIGQENRRFYLEKLSKDKHMDCLEQHLKGAL